MPLRDLFGLLAKRQTTPDKFLGSSVNVIATGQEGALRPPFSQQRGIDAYRSWVYAAATINANAVASLPVRLYRHVDAADYAGPKGRSIGRGRKAYMMGDGPGDQRPSPHVLRKAAEFGDEMEEVTGSHPVLDVLAKANPFLNGFDLTVLRVLYGELTGNAYLHPIIDEGTGLPAELWPLAPHLTEVIPDEDEFIKGYLYGLDAQRKQVFGADEVIHFRRPNPGNLFYGMGKVEAAYGAVLANTAVHDMDLATFSNSARPDYAVVVKGHPTGDQLDRFSQQVQERLRGTRKDGNFITVTGDVQFTPLNFPPKDLAGREEIVEEIAAVFGVPVSMLKANDPNLASATTGFAAWREGTILPLCRMDEQELNQSLLPLFGLEETHYICYDNPVPKDEQFALTERQTAVAGGWRTINEARMEEGREPLDNPLADQGLVGGQPLGGAAADAGGGLGLASITADEPSTTPVDSPPAPSVEQAAAIVASLKAGTFTDYTAVKLLQASGWSRAVAETIVRKEITEANVKVQRFPGEPVDDCIERGVEVLTAEGYDIDQAVAIASSQCEGEKAIADVDLKPTEEMARLAEQGLKYREEHGGGTEVGVARARDIKNRTNLSPDTIRRMNSFFSRHRVDLETASNRPGGEGYPGAGAVAWMLWGGDPGDPDGAGAGWAARKVEELEGAAEKKAPAPPKDQVFGSEENPEGSASDTRGGIEISEEQEEALKRKVEEHNEEVGDTDSKRVDLGMLKAVYRRGAGAFSTSHRPGMTRNQWAMARVNSFLYLVRNGRPESANYVTDNDLLPEGHPKKTEKEEKSCGCTKSYEWPEATRKYRLHIEGLREDFPTKATQDDPTADEDIRDDEQRTPAMVIASVVEDALAKVEARLRQAFESGEVQPVEGKAVSQSQKQRDRIARTIIASLSGLTGEITETLHAQILAAMEGGNKAAVARLNEALIGRGARGLDPIGLSEAVSKIASARAAAVANSVVTDTVFRFVSGVGQDFAIPGIDIRSRSAQIARTESARAYHDGQIDAWKQSGVVKRKHFLKAPGACEFCDAVSKQYKEGKGSLPIEEPFVKAGTTIQGTRGGRMKVGVSMQGTVHPNCRCDFVAVLED